MTISINYLIYLLLVLSYNRDLVFTQYNDYNDNPIGIDDGVDGEPEWNKIHLNINKQRYSPTCSQDDLKKFIQCFQEVPKTKYVDFEGKDILLKCRVKNGAGSIQWAFNDKMLGFNRDIPNRPRLRMPGKVTIGDHSLFIGKAQVSDSGRYECQLGPVPNQPARRSSTQVIVLKIPSKPVLYQSSKKIENRLSVVSNNQQNFNQNYNTNINLTCVSFDGNPSPNFTWTVNGKSLSQDARYTGRNGFLNKVATIRHINKSASYISIKSDYLKNDDNLGCRVTNLATEKLGYRGNSNIETLVQVIKRELPGPLKFLGPLNNHIPNTTVDEYERLKIECLCLLPGHPNIQLFWRVKSNNNPGWLRPSKIGTGTTRTSLQVNRITKKWHNATVICYGKQLGFNVDNSIKTRIIVRFKPRQIFLKAMSKKSNKSWDNPATIFSPFDRSVILKCSTSPYNQPNVQIDWRIKLSNIDSWKTLQSTPQITHSIQNGLKVTESRVEFVPDNFKSSLDFSDDITNRIQVMCRVKMMSLTHQINIEKYDVPSPIKMTINGQEKPPFLTIGEKVEITCRVPGGKPSPELYLLNDKEQEVKNVKKINKITEKKLVYEFRVSQKNMNIGYRCITKLERVLNVEPLSTDLKKLKVAIAPRKLKLKVDIPSLGGLTADQTTICSCETDASYPPAEIEWSWHHDCDISMSSRINNPQLTSRSIRNKCKTAILKNNFKTTYNAVSKKTNSQLFLKLNYTHDQSYIECVVFPNIKWQNFHRPLLKFQKLSVKYKPQFILKTKNKNAFEVMENSPFKLRLRVLSNPSVTGYTWIYNSEPISDQFETDLESISIKKITSTMMGNYNLSVQNKLGSSMYQFFLNVTYAPKMLKKLNDVKIIPFSKITQASSSNQAMLSCSAYSNPSGVNAYVRWNRVSYKSSVFKQDQSVLLALLISGNAPSSNGLNKGDLVRGSSWKTGDVHCNQGKWLKDSINVNCVTVTKTEITSTLMIQNLTPFVIGKYQCQFYNSIPNKTKLRSIHLLYPTAPVAVNNQRASSYSGKLGTRVELTCYFTTYPHPDKITWRNRNWNHSLSVYKNSDYQVRGGASRSSSKLNNGMSRLSKQVSVRIVDKSHIKVSLKMLLQTENEYGEYICEAQNNYGKGSHRVLLTRPRPPIQPQNVTLINITDTSISMGWIIGYNGGARQTIKIRVRPRNSKNSKFDIRELPESNEQDVQFFNLHGLQPDTDYEIDVSSFNEYTIDHDRISPFFIKTLVKGSKSRQLLQSKSRDNENDDSDNGINSNLKKHTNIFKSDTNKLLIIILLVLVGFLLISVKISLIAYFVRRKNKKMKKSKEMLPSPTTQHIMDDSMEMRAPSLVRSGIDSTNGLIGNGPHGGATVINGPGSVYPPSVSDRMSHNGSDSGLKLNYYKTTGSEEHYPITNYPGGMPGVNGQGGPEMDLVASALRRSHYVDPNSSPPASFNNYFQQSAGSPMHDPYNIYPGGGGCYTIQRIPQHYYGPLPTSPSQFNHMQQQQQPHLMMVHRKSSISSNETPPGSHQMGLQMSPSNGAILMSSQHPNMLPQYTNTSTPNNGQISLGNRHPSSPPSQSSGGGDQSTTPQLSMPPSSQSQQLPSHKPGQLRHKYPVSAANQQPHSGYSPLIGQSGAPSTVEEYLSTGANSASGSDNLKMTNGNGYDEYYANQLVSFKMSQHRGSNQDQLLSSPLNTNESSALLPNRQSNIRCNSDNGMVIEVHYPNMDDRLQMSMNSESEQLLKPPLGFSTDQNHEHYKADNAEMKPTVTMSNPISLNQNTHNTDIIYTNPINLNPTTNSIDTTAKSPNTNGNCATKLPYVDLIPHHSSPSVIKFNGNNTSNNNNNNTTNLSSLSSENV